MIDAMRWFIAACAAREPIVPLHDVLAEMLEVGVRELRATGRVGLKLLRDRAPGAYLIAQRAKGRRDGPNQ